MIRIITKRDARGIPEEFVDYPDREVGEVTGTLALRFDAELMALKVADLSFCGLKRWTEAYHRVMRFSEQAYNQMQKVVGPESTVPPEDRAEAMEAWVHEHPDYFLSQRVGVWAAVNLGGGRMTLLDVLDLADRDIDEVPDEPEYIDEPDADDPTGEVEGKA